MNKLLILYTTISQKSTNSTNYYQLTNYYVDKTKLLYLHRTTTKKKKLARKMAEMDFSDG